MPRGRALQPVRPGLVIKAVLMGQKPLITPPIDKEQIVTEACGTDVHYTYQRLIDRENQTREKGKHLKGLRILSFNTVWRFLRTMGLIEQTREEPMLYPPPHGNLITIVKNEYGGYEKKIQVRRIYRLTEFGRQEEVAWNDVTRAYKDFVKQGGVLWPEPRKLPPKPVEIIEGIEGIEVPVPVEEVVPEIPVEIEKPKPVKVIRRPKKEKKVVKFTLGPRPTPTGFKMLLEHIDVLVEMRITNTSLFDSEVGYIGNRVGDWQVESEDIPERYGKYTDALIRLYQALDNLELEEVQSIVQEMIDLSKQV